jgi:polyisoprenoid-binding protein YceI
MIFESTKVEKVDEENYHVFGNLTMKGVTKPVNLNVEFGGVTKIRGVAKEQVFNYRKINRTDWGINFNAVLKQVI